MGGVSRKARKQFFLACAVAAAALALTPFIQAIIITPQEASLREYASTQETIITFYNDQFEPIGCELTPAYASTYLLPYVSFEPERFILQPDAQQNVRITTTFPSESPPQEHRLVVHAYRDASETFTLRFRPPGEQRLGLVLEDAAAELSEGETLIVTLQLKNTGNLVVFARPMMTITKEGKPVKNMTYQQPVIVQPGETYPLTIRQDTAEFGTGSFEAAVRAVYAADGASQTTPSVSSSFTLAREGSSASGHAWEGALGIIIVVSFVAAMAGVWFLPVPKRRRKRQGKEKHITAPDHELIALRNELDAARGEVASLGKDVRVFAEEAERWLQQHGGNT
ncbi:hypothetical protein JXA12_03225 [Candidatus Woesearchaeota archaeon]|nr:hypothetical protein [Candidatus Woesearchaeota archaeon]